MSRNFGITSGRPALGGTSDRPSAYSADTRADLVAGTSSSLDVAWLNSELPEGAPLSIMDDRERAACFFILFFVTLVCSILLASYVAVSSLNVN